MGRGHISGCSFCVAVDQRMDLCVSWPLAASNSKPSSCLAMDTANLSERALYCGSQFIHHSRNTHDHGSAWRNDLCPGRVQLLDYGVCASRLDSSCQLGLMYRTMSTENRRLDNVAANHGELPVKEQDMHASHTAMPMAGTRAAMRPARVRPFAPPATWQVVTGQLMHPPWRLSSAAWCGLTQAVWDGSQWYAVARTADRLTVEAGGYFAWCQTNRALIGAQDVSNWPPAAQFWLRHYAWTDPPQVPSPLARIALTTGGWIRDRFGRYLAV